jgi:uncharacterized protein (DUF302 family)
MKQTKYGMNIIFNGSPEAAEEAVTEALKKVGFGVLTRIDVAATLKAKLGVEKPPYVILGACNPNFANQALEMEPELGLLLPCNVIVYRNEGGKTVISAVDPGEMLSVVGRDDMQAIAGEVKALLVEALDSLG